MMGEDEVKEQGQVILQMSAGCKEQWVHLNVGDALGNQPVHALKQTGRHDFQEAELHRVIRFKLPDALLQFPERDRPFGVGGTVGKKDNGAFAQG
jgi:hypothetical protein